LSKPDILDKQALASARRYMGEVAWLTIFLGLALGASYIATVLLALVGVLSLWSAVPLVAILTYLNYTMLHEAAHGSISGSRKSLHWVNEALGYMAAWVLMIPLTAHRHEHMAHHRHTNDAERDPDFHVGRMGHSILGAARATLQASATQFSFYAENRWSGGASKQDLILCIEVAAALIPRLAVFLAGYWAEGLALFVLAWLVGATVLLYLFAYVVHRPHENEGRYVNTSTILIPGPLQGLLTWLWMFQNYHSIHHLFPRVPFYRYGQVYQEIEEIMAAKGAPVYRLTVRSGRPEFSV
jgi:beta-carotene hydroxylase